jgi:hypothetical protein
MTVCPTTILRVFVFVFSLFKDVVPAVFYTSSFEYRTDVVNVSRVVDFKIWKTFLNLLA